MSSVASFTDTAGTTYRDEVQMSYTPLWQIETVTQQHDGAVDASSAEVLYRYESVVPLEGDDNYTRLTDIVYPTDNDGNASDQTVQYTYTAGTDDRLSRLDSIGIHGFNQSGTPLAIQELISYKRIGLGLMAESKLNINDTPGGTSGMDYITLDRTVEHNGTATAGAYPALDRFGRVTNHMWVPEGFGAGTGGFSNIPALVEIGHSYDRSSNRLSYNDAREGAKLPGRNRNFVYDRLNRLVESSTTVPSASGYTAEHSGHQWALDMLGNWDSMNTDGDNDGDFTDSPSYLDDRAANSANEIGDSGQAQYDRKKLNGSGNPTWYDYHYDDSGNLTDERKASQLPLAPATIQQGRQHSYDAWNRLVKSEMRSVDGLSTVPIAENTYNALGWRTSKKADTSVSAYDGIMDQERTFYYGASWRILEEHVDSDLSSSTDDVWISQEFWGAGYIDDSIAKRIDRGGTGDWSASNQDRSHWFRLSDTQFSVVAVLNEHGVVHERLSYDAYGVANHRFGGDANGDGSFTSADLGLGTYNGVIGSSGYHADLDFNNDGVYDGVDLGLMSTSSWTVQLFDILPEGWISDPSDDDGPDNSMGYAGYVFNAEREDYSVRFRVYSPELGRWMQRDPIGYLGGGNLYEYVYGMPMVFVDPAGLFPGAAAATAAGRAAACAQMRKDLERKAKQFNTLFDDLSANPSPLNGWGGNGPQGTVSINPSNTIATLPANAGAAAADESVRQLISKGVAVNAAPLKALGSIGIVAEAGVTFYQTGDPTEAGYSLLEGVAAAGVGAKIGSRGGYVGAIGGAVAGAGVALGAQYSRKNIVPLVNRVYNSMANKAFSRARISNTMRKKNAMDRISKELGELADKIRKCCS